MDKVLAFLKANVKAVLVVSAVGLALTLGFGSEGCDVSVAPAAVTPGLTAPAAPVAP